MIKMPVLEKKDFDFCQLKFESIGSVLDLLGSILDSLRSVLESLGSVLER